MGLEIDETRFEIYVDVLVTLLTAGTKYPTPKTWRGGLFRLTLLKFQSTFSKLIHKKAQRKAVTAELLRSLHQEAQRGGRQTDLVRSQPQWPYSQAPSPSTTVSSKGPRCSHLQQPPMSVWGFTELSRDKAQQWSNLLTACWAYTVPLPLSTFGISQNKKWFLFVLFVFMCTILEYV